METIDDIRTILKNYNSTIYSVYDVAIQDYYDSSSTLKNTYLAVAMRIIIDEILYELSPDEHLKSAEWFVKQNSNKKPTRKDRFKYALQKYHSNSFGDFLGINNIVDELMKVYKIINGYVHLENFALQDVADFDDQILPQLLTLLTMINSINESEYNLMSHIKEQLEDSWLPDELDCLSAGTIIDDWNVYDIVFNEDMSATIKGSVDCMLQYGGYDDGFSFNDNYPFTVTAIFMIENGLLECNGITNITVDTSSFYE